MNIYQATARRQLADCGIYRRDDGHFPDFHTLRSDRVEAILDLANEVKYRKPKDANGSRARYFYQMLVKRAA